MNTTMTYKDFWIEAYIALLNTNEPEAAVAKADAALSLCNKRWEVPNMEVAVRLVADKPIGEPDYSKESEIPFPEAN